MYIFFILLLGLVVHIEMGFITYDHTKHYFCRYLDRIIRSSDLQEFAALLQQHQKATTADGESVP